MISKRYFSCANANGLNCLTLSVPGRFSAWQKFFFRKFIATLVFSFYAGETSQETFFFFREGFELYFI